MSPEELLHIAYGELVEIEPMAGIVSLHLLERTYTACGPLQIARLPFYAALLLKKANMCRIRLPNYLSLENLRMFLSQETENTDEYLYLHPHFFSLANDCLNNCYNVEDAEEGKILVEKIKEARFKKTLEGIRCLDGKAVNLNNLTIFEFNEVKEFILGSMKMGKRIESGSGSQW